jgi:hypothetical protein
MQRRDSHTTGYQEEISRIGIYRETVTQRSQDIQRIPGPTLGQPLCTLTDDSIKEGKSVTLYPVNAQRTSQYGLFATTHHDKLAGSGLIRYFRAIQPHQVGTSHYYAIGQYMCRNQVHSYPFSRYAGSG